MRADCAYLMQLLHFFWTQATQLHPDIHIPSLTIDHFLNISCKHWLIWMVKTPNYLEERGGASIGQLDHIQDCV